MSKLSLSRSRGQPVGPLTSTQMPRERQPPVEGLSREELLFQRQLEAALKKSRAEFEKSIVTDNDVKVANKESDVKTDNFVEGSEADTILLSSPIKRQQIGPQKAARKLASYDSESEDDVEEVEASEDSDFCPSPLKKKEQKKAQAKPKPAPKSKAIPGVVELKDTVKVQPAKPSVLPDKPGSKSDDPNEGKSDPPDEKLDKLEYLGLKLVKSDGDKWTKQELNTCSKSALKPVKPDLEPEKPVVKAVKTNLKSVNTDLEPVRQDLEQVQPKIKPANQDWEPVKSTSVPKDMKLVKSTSVQKDMKPVKSEAPFPSSPVPSTSGLKRPRKAASKYIDTSDSEGSDFEKGKIAKDDSDLDESDSDEFYSSSSKKKRQRQNQTKKATNPPIKKSKSPPVIKSTRPSPSKKVMAPPPPLSTSRPTVKTSAAPTSTSHPANFQPDKPLVPCSTKSFTNASAMPQPSRTLPAKSVTQSKSVPEQVKTSFVPVKTSSEPTTPSATGSRPVRNLIPKWTPPAMNRSSNGGLNSSQTPSPGIGLRVGLSRNFKPVKPLHTNYKSPD